MCNVTAVRCGALLRGDLFYVCFYFEDIEQFPPILVTPNRRDQNKT